MEEKWSVAIAVRELVYFTCKGGDLNYQTSTYGRNRALEGILLHQLLQDQRPESYQKEYALKHEVKRDGVVLTVKGKADGVDFEQSPVMIEEIKSYTGKYEELGELKKKAHWEQLYCYGYMLLEDEFELDEVELVLSYIHADTEAVTQEKAVLDRKSLKRKWKALLNAFFEVVGERIAHQEGRNLHLRTQRFPLGQFRPGQREMAAAVYRSLRDKQNLFIEAPTGTGKTIGNLFPALKAMGEGHLNQVFFLTAKNTGKETAAKSIALMHQDNPDLRGLEITSKSKICFNTDLACDPEECSFARGYFDRVDGAMKELKKEHSYFDKSTIEEVAKAHHVCPFELSLDLIADTDVVVCDYNYAFDPKVMLKRSFSDENKGLVLLIDEVHNLVSRARDMYSATLDEFTLIQSKKKWAKEEEYLKKAYNAVLRQLRALRKELDEQPKKKVLELKKGPGKLCTALRSLTGKMDYWLGENPKSLLKKEMLEDYFYYVDFLRIWELYGADFTTIVQYNIEKIEVKLLCLDVAEHLKEVTDRLGGTVFFSATIAPVDFYKTSFLGDTATKGLQFPSPFPTGNSKVLIPTYISTKYSAREQSLDSLCWSIMAVVLAKEGNYMVFCPSYAYLRMIEYGLQEIIRNESLVIELLVQESEMDELAREHFIETYKTYRSGSLIGLVVSGGIFGEGIDLTHDSLIGAIIVGVGLPGISEENDAIAAYYKEKHDKGYEFAYQYPGINQVLQNAGRVIRTETDKGIICLIDDRYLRFDYSNHFPKHWNVKYVGALDDLAKEAKQFWDEVGELPEKE